VEVAVEVQLDEVRILDEARSGSLSHVEWVVLAQEGEIPGILGLLGDHIVQLVDASVDELANHWSKFLDECVDRLVEVVDKFVEVLVSEGDVRRSDSHLGHIMKLPMDIIVGGGFENHVDHDIFECNRLSAEWNEVEHLEFTVEGGVHCNVGEFYVQFAGAINLLEHWSTEADSVDVDGVEDELVKNGRVLCQVHCDGLVVRAG
jgi:hypothetical protein